MKVHYYLNAPFHTCLVARSGRIGIAAQMVGLAQGAFNKAVPYTYQRHQFGQPVGTFQGMAFSIAQAAIDLEAARLMTYNAARRRDEGKPFTKEAAMAKYLASVVAQKVSGQAIEWAGGIGFTRETGIEKFWRDSKIVSCVQFHSGRNSDMDREQSTRERRTSSSRLLPNSSRRSIPSGTRWVGTLYQSLRVRPFGFTTINNPSYTAHPMAELATLRESLSEAPSKKPEAPRC